MIQEKLSTYFLPLIENYSLILMGYLLVPDCKNNQGYKAYICSLFIVCPKNKCLEYIYGSLSIWFSFKYDLSIATLKDFFESYSKIYLNTFRCRYFMCICLERQSKKWLVYQERANSTCALNANDPKLSLIYSFLRFIEWNNTFILV